MPKQNKKTMLEGREFGPLKGYSLDGLPSDCANKSPGELEIVTR